MRYSKPHLARTPAHPPAMSSTSTAPPAPDAMAELHDADQTDDQIATAQERLDEERERNSGAHHAAIAASTAAQGSTQTDDAADTKKRSRRSRATAAEDEAEATPPSPKRSRHDATASASASAPTSSTAAAAGTGGQTNVRLERLRLALARFLELIEYRVTTDKISKSLPRLDREVVEAIRHQFLGQLKDVIKEENENLIIENDLEHKLAELHEMVREADERFQKGVKVGDEEVRDVWRPDLDIETAISARAIPDQEQRVAALREELEQILDTNATIHADLKSLSSRTEEKRVQAREALDALDASIQALEADPAMEKRLRETMDGLLADLGARM
ncbi:hypothetical protein ACQY0O_004233 [Thecaphora frezii]